MFLWGIQDKTNSEPSNRIEGEGGRAKDDHTFRHPREMTSNGPWGARLPKPASATPRIVPARPFDERGVTDERSGTPAMQILGMQADVAQIWPSLASSGPKSAEVGPRVRSKSGLGFGQKLEQTRSPSAKFGLGSAEFVANIRPATL